MYSRVLSPEGTVGTLAGRAGPCAAAAQLGLPDQPTAGTGLSALINSSRMVPNMPAVARPAGTRGPGETTTIDGGP